MSASTAIGMVSASLRNLLVGEMHLQPAVDVTVLAPDEPGPARRVNLFLYKLTENPFLKNQDWTVKPGAANQLVPPPLSLSLFYLLTAHAPNDQVTGNTNAHEILGEAMRVLYETPVIPAAYLHTGLADAREHLQVASNALDPEELSRIWATFSQPFRLSVLYQVSTVQLDRLPAALRPLPKRVTRIGVPEVRAPHRPPTVDAQAPASGPAGTVLTFTGAHLDGWRANVIVGDRSVLADQPISGDAFTVTLPADLQPGFYDLRVDVSHLFRRTFLFEVVS